MVDTFTSGKMHATKPSNGSDVGTWDVPVNENMDIADACMSGTTSLTLSNANVALTQSQMQVQRILCTGTLTADVTVSFLGGVPGNFIIDNQTTGSFTVTVDTASGGSTGIVAPQDYRSFVFSDGTNVSLADDGVAVAPPGSITNASLANMAAGTLKGNLSGGSAAPSDNTISAVAAALGQYMPPTPLVKNLQITNGATPNSQIAVTADSAIIGNAAGTAAVYRSAIAFTISSGTAGANGLDTGTLAVSTWYYVYLIDNGTAPAGLISKSATAPTLPSGYTYYERIGTVRTDSVLNFYRTLQVGKVTQFTVRSGTNTAYYLQMATGAYGNVSVPTYVTVNVASFVPPTATEIDVVLVGVGNIILVGPSSGFGSYTSSSPPPFATYFGVYSVTKGRMVLESSNLYYASQGGSMFCAGWVDAVRAF